MFETQMSGKKTSLGEIGLDIRTYASPKVKISQGSKHIWKFFYRSHTKLLGFVPIPPPILRLCIALFAVAEGWLLLGIGRFLLLTFGDILFHESESKGFSCPVSFGDLA